MRELTYRQAALDDLDAIYDRIEPDNPRRAASFVQDIRTHCRTLLEHPEFGPSRGYIRPGLRIYPMLGHVVVCYRIDEQKIIITRVFSGGQDYTTILSQQGDE